MEQYVINPRSGKLHKADCNRLGEAFKFNGNVLLLELLADCNFKVDCCVCLKKDEKAQSAVCEHKKAREQRRRGK